MVDESAAENVMEEELLKQMLKQDNEINAIRSAVLVVNRTFRNGIFIGKKTLNPEPEITEGIEDEDK